MFNQGVVLRLARVRWTHRHDLSRERRPEAWLLIRRPSHAYTCHDIRAAEGTNIMAHEWRCSICESAPNRAAGRGTIQSPSLRGKAYKK